MPSKSVSFTGRALAALVLAGAAVPTVQAWRHSHSGAVMAQAEASTGYDTDAQWTLPDTLELQLKPGVSGDALAELSKKVGANVVFNSDTGAETGVARVTLPDGANVQAAHWTRCEVTRMWKWRTWNICTAIPMCRRKRRRLNNPV